MVARRMRIGAGATEDALTTAWVNAVVGDGGTVSSGRRTTVNTLIAGLRTDGLIAKLDRLWIFAAENAFSAKRDLIAAAAATAVGAPTFAADNGYTGTNAAQDVYIDTNFNANTQGVAYVQNSAHLSLWNLSNITDGNPAIGVIGANPLGQNVYPKHSNTNFYTRINDDPEMGGLSIGDPRGHLIGNRSGATAREAYQNASSLGTSSDASQAPINGNIIALASRDQTTSGSAYQLAQLSIGGSLSSGNATLFYNRLRTYMTAVGVP